MNSETPSSIMDGWNSINGLMKASLNAVCRLIVPNASVSEPNTNIMLGSKIEDRVISLELPMPPKVFPESSPESAIKNFARVIR